MKNCDHPILSSIGYPNGYSKSESFRFRTSGAQTYYLSFNDIDLDSDCGSYVNIYDDEQIVSYPQNLCTSDSGILVEGDNNYTRNQEDLYDPSFNWHEHLNYFIC